MSSVSATGKAREDDRNGAVGPDVESDDAAIMIDEGLPGDMS